MVQSKLSAILGAAAVMVLGVGAAHAQAAPQDVNVVNPVDTNVINIPDVRVVNTPTVNNVPPVDSDTFVKTIDNVSLGNAFTTDVDFTSLVGRSDDRLIIDYVSVDGAVAPFQRMWASFLPCTEKGNFGRIAVPLTFDGPVYNGATRVNDYYSANVAMQTYVDQGCTATVRIFRSPTSGLGHAHVTLQGHRVKRGFPIIVSGQ